MRRLSSDKIPYELDLSAAHGFTMRGWDFDTELVRDSIRAHRMLNPAIELGVNICPFNCSYCFTEPVTNPDGTKRQPADGLSLEERLRLVDDVADLGAKTLNFVGAGEPTVDPDFWTLVEKIVSRGLTPIIYTEGSLRLKDRGFASRLYELGATIVLKVNSLSNAAYQDRVVRGIRPKPGVPRKSYTLERQRAMEVLFELGFNATVPTRLAFDTIVCRENIDEIEAIHRFARDNNIFALFVNYLPSGRTANGHTTAILPEEQFQIYKQLAEIDARDYGLEHSSHFPYAGGVPCTIRGLGIYVTIRGDAFDCPGQAVALGNIRQTSITDIWETVRPITHDFDGTCLPRKLFWAKMARINEHRAQQLAPPSGEAVVHHLSNSFVNVAVS